MVMDVFGTHEARDRRIDPQVVLHPAARCPDLEPGRRHGARQTCQRGLHDGPLDRGPRCDPGR